MTPWSEMLSVSVVIPTTGRASLSRAIRSVRRQDYAGHIEIVLVLDKPRTEVLQTSVTRLVDRVLWTGGSRGAAVARNLGTAHATGDLVAFLDDDDEWTPRKLSTQVETIRSVSGATVRNVVVGSRHRTVHDGRLSEAIVPVRVFEPSRESIAEFLFLRRRPGAGRSSLYTSTLLTTRKVASEVLWDENLSRHQDWDWLVRAEKVARLAQCSEALTLVHVGSEGSISSSTDWRTSVDWAERILLPESRRVYVDFLAAQSLRYALGARSARGVRKVLSMIVGARRLPSFGPTVIGFAGVLPRRQILDLMRRIH